MRVVRIICLSLAALLMAAPAFSAKRPVRKAATKRTARVKPARSGSAAKSKSKSKATRRRPPAVARRSSQTAPTPERYREIQQALVERGFLQGEPSGVWAADSVDALKRFQKEKNIAPSGKLDSVTLIALGLGPKRNLAAGNSPDPNTLPRPQDDHRRSQGSERP